MKLSKANACRGSRGLLSETPKRRDVLPGQVTAGSWVGVHTLIVARCHVTAPFVLRLSTSSTVYPFGILGDKSFERKYFDF